MARSRTLLGNWEKNPANPILAENENWQTLKNDFEADNVEGARFALIYEGKQKSRTPNSIG